ncbi:MAG: helix-turn-helix domain-containing protein [Nitrososphaera sp.]|nr:helix-turn-helix domain-containing protein [Nitrososphaera sp.]
MSTVVNKRLLGVKAAADYLSISRSKLYEWALARRIQSVKIDGRRLFDVKDLDAFVDALKSDGNHKSSSQLDFLDFLSRNT